MLDTRNRLLAFHNVSTGTLSATLVHPRDVFGPALRTLGVASIVLVHNHRSGDPCPSSEDLVLTRRLCEVGDLVGIRVLDHIVLGHDGAFRSFADEGLLGGAR